MTNPIESGERLGSDNPAPLESSPGLDAEHLSKLDEAAAEAQASEPQNEDELNKRIDVLKREAGLDEEKDEQKEKELREKREEAVNAWIETSKSLIEKAEEGYAVNVWQEAQNASKAQEFLLENIESVIRESEAVKSYLETGEPKNLNLHWEIFYSDYELPNGSTGKFISNIDAVMLVGGEPEIEPPQKEPGKIQEELLDENQQEMTRDAKEVNKYKELKRNSAYMLP